MSLRATCFLAHAATRVWNLALYALVIAGIDPNITTDMSPISWAAQHEWVEGIAVLLECGADPDVCAGVRGGPPL